MDGSLPLWNIFPYSPCLCMHGRPLVCFSMVALFKVLNVSSDFMSRYKKTWFCYLWLLYNFCPVKILSISTTGQGSLSILCLLVIVFTTCIVTNNANVIIIQYVYSTIKQSYFVLFIFPMHQNNLNSTHSFILCWVWVFIVIK